MFFNERRDTYYHRDGVFNDHSPVILVLGWGDWNDEHTFTGKPLTLGGRGQEKRARHTVNTHTHTHIQT